MYIEVNYTYLTRQCVEIICIRKILPLKYHNEKDLHSLLFYPLINKTANYYTNIIQKNRVWILLAKNCSSRAVGNLPTVYLIF